jgi:predicted AlkP superfamily phosphohydrolase/phosphomutase
VLLVVAWDGACFELVDPLVAAGELPVLAALLARGSRRPVRSTTPAVTFPAWTSFMTAASPDRHGVTDFTVREGYRVRFVNATHRRLPTIWSVMSRAGLRVGVYGVPATYPPEAFGNGGIQVCGFDTPLGSGAAGRATHPNGLAARLSSRYGSLATDGPSQSRIEEGWHERALARMLADIELRTTIVADLLTGSIDGRFDAFMVHFGESDTVAHQFWQLCDPRSPRFVPGHVCAHALAEVYRALDRSLGRLLEAAGADSDVVVLSDHGAGGSSDRAVCWNRWLADHGWLAFHGRRGGALGRTLKRAALRAVPAAMQAELFAALPRVSGRLESAARFGGIDWSRTTAFSEELNYFPSIWLNVRGREPEGTVDEADAPALAARIADALMAWRDPIDGEPVVEAVRRREELADGPFAGRLPDLVLELREPGGYSYSAIGSRGGAEPLALRRLDASEMTGARGTSMAGSHRMQGLSVVAGPRVAPGIRAGGTLPDAGATVLALAGLSCRAGADGRPWPEVATEVRATVPTTSTDADGLGPVESYTPEAEHEVASRLRALGYID